jgi:hypothetical protein
VRGRKRSPAPSASIAFLIFGLLCEASGARRTPPGVWRVVDQDDVSFKERWSKHFFDISEETFAIDWAVEDEGGGDAIMAKRGHESRRLPMCTSLDLIRRSMSDFGIHRLGPSLGAKHDRRGGLDAGKDASTGQSPRIARAGKTGAIARCLQRAFFRTPYGVLDGVDGDGIKVPRRGQRTRSKEGDRR